MTGFFFFYFLLYITFGSYPVFLPEGMSLPIRNGQLKADITAAPMAQGGTGTPADTSLELACECPLRVESPSSSSRALLLTGTVGVGQGGSHRLSLRLGAEDPSPPKAPVKM